MSKSRMMADEGGEDATSPSPRKTIVGGRPPEASGGLPAVPSGIQRLLRLASVDAGFRRELVARRGEVADAAEVPLTSSERSILAAIGDSQLLEMTEKMPPPPNPRRDFLRQTAATAVVLLGGAAIAEGSGCKPSTEPTIPTTAEADAGAPEDPPQRPHKREMDTDGGAEPDMPPERPDKREMETEGGAAPDEPERPELSNMVTGGGIAPDKP